MRVMLLGRYAVSTLLCSVLGVALAQDLNRDRAAKPRPNDVPFSALVETIEFTNVPLETRALIVNRIGVRPGDALTAETRHRIARELGKAGKGLTFTYRPGSKPGAAKLIISGDC